jgi:stage II sporulation protein AA (anti-sigma F factor antagonist)
MSDPAAFLVARHGATVFVRSLGLANMKNAPMLDAFLQAESVEVTTICVDLSACNGMDSTFMGLLVGYSQQLSRAGGKVVVVNPTEQNRRLLDMLGVSTVLPVIAQEAPLQLEFVSLPAGVAMNPAQRIELVRRAHQNLVALTPANQVRFSAFLTALEGDLQRLKGGGAQK